MTDLTPAIKYFGSAAAAARAVKRSPMAATQWKKRGLPPEVAVELSEAANGAFKPSDLIPDFKWE